MREIEKEAGKRPHPSRLLTILPNSDIMNVMQGTLPHSMKRRNSTMKKILALLVSVVMLLAVGAVYANAFSSTTAVDTGICPEFVVTAIQTGEVHVIGPADIAPDIDLGTGESIIWPEVDTSYSDDSVDTEISVDISISTKPIGGTLASIVCPSCGYKFLSGTTSGGMQDVFEGSDDAVGDDSSADTGAHPGDSNSSNGNHGADTDHWGATDDTCAPADTHIPDGDVSVAPAPAPVEPETGVGRYAYREEEAVATAPDSEWAPADTTATPDDNTWAPEEDTYVPDDKDDAKEDPDDENQDFLIGVDTVITCPKCGCRFRLGDAISEMAPENQMSSAEKNTGDDDDEDDDDDDDDDDETRKPATQKNEVDVQVEYADAALLGGCAGTVGVGAAAVVLTAAAAAVALKKKD